MNVQIGRALVAALIALAAQSAAAQSMSGGVRGLDERLRALEALNETNIVGRWAVSGTTDCLVSSRGFDANLAPLAAPPQNIVSQLTANSTGTRTFIAGGTGTSTGETQSLTHPATVYGGPPPIFGGGASIAGIGGSFTWEIKPDGTLFIQDTNPIVQPLIEPPSRKGFSANILDLQSYVGQISKDRRTITMSHPTMKVETSEVRDPAGNFVSSTQRICWRYRVLTRLPD